MKKRMLITTIVMVLVVAIALTTSSLAWFTMSASVEISEVSFGAVTYDGAQLSVAPLARTGWGASASIGTGVTFDPAQGEPEVADLTYDENNVAEAYDTPTITAEAFQAATDVTTTAAGNTTANQQVELLDSASAVFIGGFNVRNDGAANASVTVSCELKVGEAHLVNPLGDGNTADDYYVYGDYATTAGITWDGVNGWYTSSLSAVETQAAFTKNETDIALAGGLRVAIFDRTWTWDVATNTYTDGVLTPVAIYGFTEYKVQWTASGWSATEATSTTNELYVTDPDLGVYSMNNILAEDAAHYVAAANVAPAGEATMSQYDCTELGNNTIPAESYTLNAEAAGVRSGVEVVVVVWMDGWDNESVPAAGGGRVSLAYAVSSETAG